MRREVQLTQSSGTQRLWCPEPYISIYGSGGAWVGLTPGGQIADHTVRPPGGSGEKHAQRRDCTEFPPLTFGVFLYYRP